MISSQNPEEFVGMIPKIIYFHIHITQKKIKMQPFFKKKLIFL